MALPEVFVAANGMRKMAIVIYWLFIIVAPAIAQDGSVHIDFEQFPGPDGILESPDDVAAPSPCDVCRILSNEYSSMGITFTAGTLDEGNLFPGSATTNHFITSTPPDATFSRLVTGISITSYSFWTATLYALDENNNVIASNTLANPNAGSAFFLGTLSVSANRPIHRFTVLPEGCQIGIGRCDQILNLDNLLLAAPTAPPPPNAPGIPSLTRAGLVELGLVLGLVGAALLRKTQQRA